MNQYAAKARYDELHKQGIQSIITSNRGDCSVEPATKPDAETEINPKGEQPKADRASDKRGA